MNKNRKKSKKKNKNKIKNENENKCRIQKRISKEKELLCSQWNGAEQMT